MGEDRGPLSRNATTGAYRELFAAWGLWQGEAAPAVAISLARVLARFEEDRGRFGDVLEPSLSWEKGRASWRRLSYGLPGFRGRAGGGGAEEGADALRMLCGPFGGAVAAQVERVVRAARHPAVVQPIFGLADDGPGALRIKLYLQLHDGAGDAAVALTERLLGARLAGRLPVGAALHLVGLDLGAHGDLTGAKLYLRHARVPLREVAARIGPVPLLEALGEALGEALSTKPRTTAQAGASGGAGGAVLREVLAIHRLEGPDDAGVERPVEIDVAVGDTGLGWPALRALLPVAARGEGSALARLEAAVPLVPRRLSTPVGRDDKVNLYYVLGPEVAR
ncbi:Hypothetical protein CAP_7825 [Chondromyces apiculatus DSM 436]|uniref:Uncharacterized protein n=1 Tax=Chondromyces apiculatus DSM 436 TaxID=1192034 RepID=A0A017SXP0_9BACT|nr:Hypothetical protein CAP_7825 [Chondromyces apiculatus DSM 436]